MSWCIAGLFPAPGDSGTHTACDLAKPFSLVTRRSISMVISDQKFPTSYLVPHSGDPPFCFWGEYFTCWKTVRILHSVCRHWSHYLCLMFIGPLRNLNGEKAGRHPPTWVYWVTQSTSEFCRLLWLPPSCITASTIRRLWFLPRLR